MFRVDLEAVDRGREGGRCGCLLWLYCVHGWRCWQFCCAKRRVYALDEYQMREGTWDECLGGEQNHSGARLD